MELPFSLDLVRFLAEHRHGLLTPILQLFTAIGELQGYILIIALIYATLDKPLAVRLALLTLFAMALNDTLKALIGNPRPFVIRGEASELWAVSTGTAAQLATEFSTPSGHAVGGAAFYTYLYKSVRSRALRFACVALILLTGLSRPYLGVHYLEDVLIGWALGVSLALLAKKHGASIEVVWNQRSLAQQVGAVAGTSLAVWLLTLALGWRHPQGPSFAFVSDTGFLMGIVIGHALETRGLRFDPRSSPVAIKLLRYGLTLGLVMGSLLLLHRIAGGVAAGSTALGQLFRFVRYAFAGIVGLYLAPLLFLKLGWAERMREQEDSSHTAQMPDRKLTEVA